MRVLQLMSLDRLKETEEYDSQRASRLADTIFELGFWTVPIAVEYSKLAIMDGHHRFNAAKLLNLARAPCVLMDYQKSGVTVQSWRSDWDITVERIFWMLEAGKKFPIKTTRHSFDPPVKEIMLPLSLLY